MTAPRREAGSRRIVLSLGTGALSFALTATAIHTLLPPPLTLHADVRSEKLAMLKGWHGTAFSAAFGSSHMHDGFAPAVFDRELADANGGTPLRTHSVNLAIEGGSQTEQRVVALEFVKQLQFSTDTPPQTCLVILEIGAGANFTNDHLVHPRAINIYDWRTVQFVRRLVSPAMTKAQRVGRVGYSVAASGLYYLNLGMLSNAIFSPPLSQKTLQDQTIGDRRGQDVQVELPEVLPRITRLIASAPSVLPVSQALITPGNSDLIAEIAKAQPGLPLSFAYIEMPKAADGSGAFDFPDHLSVSTGKGVIQVPIINLARPDRFPQFYQSALWHDEAHLTGRGADLVTATFARQLKLWYAAHGTPRTCGG